MKQRSAMEDTVQRVVSLRADLEDNVRRLRGTLQQWRTWEAEYDALREEVNALPADATTVDVRNIASTFGGETIKHEDIEELLGTAKNISRSRGQIAALISRRIDWVQQNCRSASKQLVDAQSKLNNGEGQEIFGSDAAAPSTDIIERLDEEDNVMSAKLARPGEHADDIIDMLRNAGVGNEGDEMGSIAVSNSPRERSPAATVTQSSATAKSTSSSQSSIDSNRKPQIASKKCVRFAEDTDSSREKSSSLPRIPADAANVDIKHIVNGSFDPGEKVWQVGEDDRPIDFHSPHVPVDESPDDAALRRQMLQYNMQEVGAVVAEMDLEEGDNGDCSSSDEDELDVDSITDDDDEDEDEYGRTTRQVVSDEYRSKMLELERQLGAQMIQNVGPDPHRGESRGAPVNPDGHQDSLKDPKDDKPDTSRKSGSLQGTRSVRFADDLDIAPSTQDDVRPSSHAQDHYTEAMAATIVERRASRPYIKKQSNIEPQTGFKHHTSPLTQASNTLSSSVIERPPKESVDCKEAPAKKVSRFKAARSGQ